MKHYQTPAVRIVKLQIQGFLVNGSSTITKVGGNADVNYDGGKGDFSARVKSAGNFSVWDDNWSEE